MHPSRRSFVLGGIALAASACDRSGVTTAPAGPRTPSDPDPDGSSQVDERIARLERELGARIGVFAFSPGSDRVTQHRADERFALCSTFKWLLAAAALVRVDRAELALTERLAFGESDLLEWAPAARQALSRGHLTIEEAARAAVTVSDNTAANLLLARLGGSVENGPRTLTEFFRSVGDDVSRLDRVEPALNENAPGDERDTTSPRAMASNLAHVLAGNVLGRASRERLEKWLEEASTGLDRLRGGFPPGRAGDKTGTGARGAHNDVAFLELEGGSPLYVAVYLDGGSAGADARSAAHRAIGRIVVREKLE